MTWLEVGIVTDDDSALVAFYTAAFGFEVERLLEFPQGTVHRLRCGDAGLKIYRPAAV
jgi:uncharacterized glyoxalase superfamily protein PhnB